MSTTVKRHGGFVIEQDDEGYFWSQGDDHFDTAAECAASIDRFNRDERENDPDWPPLDTPSLGEPWWANR